MTKPDNQKQSQWDALWVNAQLATMADEGYGIVTDAAIAAKDGRIAWLGAMKALPGAPELLAQEVHDAKGKWFTPGLIDCHTHIVYGGNRADEFAERMKGKTYADIAKAGGGILSTVHATRAANEPELLQSAEKRLASFLREGVTTMEIKSGYGLTLEDEMKMLRVARMLELRHPISIRTTFLGAHTTPPEYAGDNEKYVDAICNDMLPAIAKSGLADAVDGFCESIAFSSAQMEKIFTVATRLGFKIKLHAEQLSDQGGAALAAKYNALSADHLEHASETGIMAMGKAGTVAVLLPGAFYMLRETCTPPVEVLRKHNVPIALASDCNPGTSPVCSLLLMLNMGCVLFGLTPEEALAGVTRNAARALGLNDVGVLEAGKVADMAVWDISHPLELSYQLGYNPCRGVIKRGIFREI